MTLIWKLIALMDYGSFSQRPFDSPFGLAQGEPPDRKNSPGAQLILEKIVVRLNGMSTNVA
jgi:hypothetical protein